MAWRPHGRAQVDARNPSAFSVCDRCNFLFNHKNQTFQYDWGGPQLINKQLLVCDRCLDVPQEQLRSIVLPPDPVPIQNPRPEYYEQDFITYLMTEDGNYLTLQNGDFFLTNNSLPPQEYYDPLAATVVENQDNSDLLTQEDENVEMNLYG